MTDWAEREAALDTFHDFVHDMVRWDKATYEEAWERWHELGSIDVGLADGIRDAIWHRAGGPMKGQADLAARWVAWKVSRDPLGSGNEIERIREDNE